MERTEWRPGSAGWRLRREGRTGSVWLEVKDRGEAGVSRLGEEGRPGSVWLEAEEGGEAGVTQAVGSVPEGGVTLGVSRNNAPPLCPCSRAAGTSLPVERF